MLEAYEDEGKFGKNENDQFLALFNANKDSFDTTTVDFAKLNYQIGMMYFNYYTNDDGSVNFSNRVQKAYSFFASNFENSSSNEFEYKNISDCYYQICSFYKMYILNSATVEEASKDNYEVLFQTIEETLGDIKDAGPYDQLALYNGVFMLLYDQRTGMQQVNVDKEDILSLMKEVYDGAKMLTVQKEQSQKMQSEIVDNYDDYVEAIERAYTNAEEK